MEETLISLAYSLLITYYVMVLVFLCKKNLSISNLEIGKYERLERRMKRLLNSNCFPHCLEDRNNHLTMMMTI